jgi:inner membrane protein
MDSATHLVMGIGLAGLAYVDPVVAADPALASAVAIGTVVAAQAPDFDGITRFKSSGAYIKHHRGITHSFPAAILWSLLISGGIYVFYNSSIAWTHLWFWTLASVLIHIGIDLFNAYGTQALRPFSDRWISWNILHIFDGFIFGSHIIAIILWLADVVHPAPLFVTLYALNILYIAWQTYIHHAQVKKLRERLGPDGKLTIIPTFRFNSWNVIWWVRNEIHIGESRDNELQWVDLRKKTSHPAIEASKKHPDIAAFLYFTKYAIPELTEIEDGFEVRWSDVRYRNRRHYPFMAAANLNQNYEVTQTFVGWIYSEKQIEKRLKASTQTNA